MIFIGIIVGIILNNLFPNLNRLLLSAIRLLILPLVVGIGYEFIMFAGKHDNIFTRILSAPGLWMQKITTREPTRDMLEIAIISIKCALRDDFPEFKAFYELKPWEKKEEPAQEDDNSHARKEAADEKAEGEKEFGCDSPSRSEE